MIGSSRLLLVCIRSLTKHIWLLQSLVRRLRCHPECMWRRCLWRTLGRALEHLWLSLLLGLRLGLLHLLSLGLLQQELSAPWLLSTHHRKLLFLLWSVMTEIEELLAFSLLYASSSAHICVIVRLTSSRPCCKSHLYLLVLVVSG